jgi:hypothetical protein
VLVLAAVVLVLAVAAVDDAHPSEADVLRSRGAAATGGSRPAGRRAAPGLRSLSLAINNLTGAPDVSNLPGQVLRGRDLRCRRVRGAPILGILGKLVYLWYWASAIQTS